MEEASVCMEFDIFLQAFFLLQLGSKETSA